VRFSNLDGLVPNAADAIISIHPAYADAILAGKKTIELRRRIPKLPLGTRLWIYATRPTAAVIGFVTIQDVARAHPRTIWQKHRNGTGVDHASFKAYFNGAQEAVAILLEAARRVGPITIDQLREIRDSFHPPQVLIRLTTAEGKALRRLAKQ
jgi:predicted transcriptional regulator